MQGLSCEMPSTTPAAGLRSVAGWALLANVKRLLAATLLLLCLATLSTYAATFTGSLDRDTITLGESATLSLAFSGGTPGTVPTPPEVPNLQITFSGNSQEITTINGQFSATVSYNFTLTPRQPGDFTIPAITVDVAGQKLATQPLQLKVLKPSPPPPAAIQSGSQPAFMRLLLPKKEIYVGETIVAQVQIYVRNGLPISNFQTTGFPAEGFTIGKQIEGQHRLVQVGTTTYAMIPVNIALQAVKAGSVTVGPYTANAVLGSRDPFDMFFGRSSEQKQMVLATESQPVQLLPLPREGVPPEFNGAVGTYSMSVTAGPTNLAVGDPITVRVQLSGRGWLDALALPAQPAWHDFNTYPPTSKVETTDSLGLQGTKTFEQVVIPQNADVKALPPFGFSFFDPDQKKYRRLEQPAIALVVRPAGAAATPTYLAGPRTGSDNPTPSQDIVANKQRLGTLAQIGAPLLLQPWFLTLQGLPVLAFLGAVVWRKRTDNLANNPRLRRRRHVAHEIREGLNHLRVQAEQNNSEQFFATLVRLLQEQLGERLDVPASSITEAVIDEQLRPRRVPETTLAPLADLFQKCNLARYAPVKSSQELTDLLPQLEAVLANLQEIEA